MDSWRIRTANALFISVYILCRCDGNETRDPCLYLKNLAKTDDLVLRATSDNVRPERLNEIKQSSRVCLPPPCDKLEAYSGFIPVDNESDSSYSFFLHIKSPSRSSSKPLLLWIQGGPWKSSLFSQFLENGPLGINATGGLYYRNHSLLRDFNLIYLDQPVGSGFSFDDNDRYPGTLDEASEQALTFLKRFLRTFPEYKHKEFYIAGESYGARSAVGVAYKLLKKHKQIDLKLKGAMLGVGFVFPLLELLNSTDYLFYSGLLGGFGRRTFAGWFDMIKGLVDQKLYAKATEDLYRIVLNQAPPGNMTLFQYLTGFQHHGSIARPQEPDEVKWYMVYANSENFKKIIHVNVSRVLDGCRPLLAKELINGDFYVDVKRKLEYVLNSAHTLFYTAQYDAVFPEINIESCFQKLRWHASHRFLEVKRKPWFVQGNRSLPLLGYERMAGTLLYTSVLWGGHDVSLDKSVVVSELYHRFLKLSREGKLLWTDLSSGT